MRENKFRGKSIYGCKWVYGDLLQYRVYPVIFDEDKEQHEVQATTVGQYIGKQDMEGTDIYEGDILMERFNEGCLNEAIIDIRKLDGLHIRFYHAKIVGNIHEKKDK